MEKDSQNKKYLPQISLLLSGFLYALYGPLTRITGTDFGEVTQTLIRALIRLIIIFLIIVFVKDIKKINRRDLPWFILSGIAAAGTTLLYTYAIQEISMGTTMFLFYGTGTVISFLIGKIFYKENLEKKKLISLFISIIGLLLLFVKDINFSNLIYLIFAGLAGLCYGSYSSFSKKISGKYPISQIVLSYAIIEIFIYILSIIFIKESSNFTSLTPWITNFIYAIVVTANVYLMVYGFKHTEAQKASLILLSELIFIIILGILFYQEIPSRLEIIGGVLITIGLVLPNINFTKFNKNFK